MSDVPDVSLQFNFVSAFFPGNIQYLRERALFEDCNQSGRITDLPYQTETGLESIRGWGDYLGRSSSISF
jgi:hypothetical protein